MGKTTRIMGVLFLASVLSIGYTSGYSHSLLLRAESAITAIILNLENADATTTQMPSTTTPATPITTTTATSGTTTASGTPSSTTTGKTSSSTTSTTNTATTLTTNTATATSTVFTTTDSSGTPTPSATSTTTSSATSTTTSSATSTTTSSATSTITSSATSTTTSSEKSSSTLAQTSTTASTTPEATTIFPIGAPGGSINSAATTTTNTSSRKKRNAPTIYYYGVCPDLTQGSSAEEVIILINCSLTNLKFSTVNEGMINDLEASAEWSGSIDLSDAPLEDIENMLILANRKHSDMQGYLGVALNSPFFLAFIGGIAAALVLLFIGFIQLATPAKTKKPPPIQQQSPKKSPKKVERSPTQREFEQTRLNREREERKKEKTSLAETDSFDRDSLPSVLPDNDDVYYGAYKKTSFQTFGHNRNPNVTSGAEYAAPHQATTVTDSGPRKESSMAATSSRKPSVKKIDNQTSRPVVRPVSGAYIPGSGNSRPISGVYAPIPRISDSRPVSGQYGPRTGDSRLVSGVYRVGYTAQQKPVRKRHYDYLMEENENKEKMF